MPEGNGINAAQRAVTNMPAARVTNLLGGMGTVWNCVAPRLHPEIEHWPGISAAEWDRAYRRAEELLRVRVDPAGHSRRQDFVLGALGGLGAMPAPVAAEPRTASPGLLCWTGPAEILNGHAAAPIEVLPQHAVRRLTHRRGRVLTAEAVDLGTGRTASIGADVFVTALGGLRTPALLWASGIGTEGGESGPLGRYLCDHPLVYAQVVLDPGCLDPEEAAPDPLAVVPISGTRPFHALLLCGAYDAGLLEGRLDERLILSLYWYTTAKPRFDNRVRFGGATDAVGLPRPTFDYRLDDEDRRHQEAALEDLRTAARSLGEYLPTSPPQKLSPGSSMHVMGTTRMGTTNDGSSVVDSWGRVWDFDNLYLGGTGLIPSATATNPTLAACALGVRTAEHITTA